MGRVTVDNADSDRQFAHTMMVHDANIILAEDRPCIGPGGVICFYLQAGLVSHRDEVVTLQCSTYSGDAHHASLIAIQVDTIHEKN